MSDVLPLANNEAARELSRLNENKCSLVTTSYGDELVLGFGSTHVAGWPLGEIRLASWMLYTRSTPWILETPNGVVATDRRRLRPITLRRIERAVLNVRVRDTQIRNSAQALTLHFANQATFSLLPSAAEVKRGGAPVDVWELHMPDSRVLRASADGQVQLMHGDEELPEPEFEGDLVAAAEVGDPMSVVLSKEAAIRGRKESAFWRALRGAVRSLGYELFEPSVTHDSGVDAIVVGPEGKIVAVQYKHRLRDTLRSGTVERLGRLLVVTDEPSVKRDAKSLASARSRGLKVAQVSWIDAAPPEVADSLRALMDS